VSVPNRIADVPTGRDNGVDDVGSINLRGVTVALDTDPGRDFTTDCVLNTEGLLSDKEIKSKWGLNDVEWIGLSDNSPLLNAVRAERDRRILNGDAAREAAQRHYAKAPNVLGDILADEQVSPGNRIEAAKELRQAASNDPKSASGPMEKFVINIDLGGDEKLVFEREISRRSPPWVSHATLRWPGKRVSSQLRSERGASFRAIRPSSLSSHFARAGGSDGSIGPTLKP
jgi:hypothetical protein